MAKKKDTTNRCPLCGTKFRVPSYKCKNCNNFYTEDGVIEDKGGKARCPDCKLRVKRLSKEEIIKELKCKECGVSLKEIKSLREIVTVHTLDRPTKDLKALETDIDALSEEIDKILDEDEVEKPRVYNCPKCGKEIKADSKACPYCKLKFSKMDEIPEALKTKKIKESRQRR
jgi:DNA-directed RNA polymerase subunit RPC12/RpoP